MMVTVVVGKEVVMGVMSEVGWWQHGWKWW